MLHSTGCLMSQSTNRLVIVRLSRVSMFQKSVAQAYDAIVLVWKVRLKPDQAGLKLWVRSQSTKSSLPESQGFQTL
jgi:hypothetical protein